MKKLPDKFCIATMGRSNTFKLKELFENNFIDYGAFNCDGDCGFYYLIDDKRVRDCTKNNTGYPVIDLSTYSKESSISLNYLIL